MKTSSVYALAFVGIVSCTALTTGCSSKKVQEPQTAKTEAPAPTIVASASAPVAPVNLGRSSTGRSR